MDTSLPSRPNLDHLRRQAKSLLAALAAGDADAAQTFREHLPAAKGMKPAQIRTAGFRLADAQSAIARRTGFASWPQLARHVEQLRSLEGTWSFASLEVDGSRVPATATQSSKLLIDGDRFRMESPEATYEGIFNINVEAQPHHIDIEFVEGPEAGNWNYGIFRVEGERLEICLDMRGKARPTAFSTTSGSGHAFEVLVRDSHTRPNDVQGGARKTAKPAPAPPAFDQCQFAFQPSDTLSRLAGEWAGVKIVRDGQELPAFMLKTAHRSATNNEITISVGGSTVIHALVRIDEAASPMHVDYLNIGGLMNGTIQHGIMEWRGDQACFCMAAPGQGRPDSFESSLASGRTLSIWKKA